MWIVLNNAYLSIVKPRGAGEALLVRARIKGDIERVFPKAEVQETTQRDYRFRAMIAPARVAQALADAVMGIDYPNFKGSVHETLRHDAYMRIWSTMYGVQNTLQGRTIAQHEKRRAPHGRGLDFLD